MKLHSINDFAKAAKNKLPKEVFDFFSGGSMNEITLANNEKAFQKIALLPQVLKPVKNISTKITLLNHHIRAPIITAPTAFQKLAHNDGELATARAINIASLGMIVSTMSSISLEEIANNAGDSLLFFQLYIYKDRGFTKELIHRAEIANYKAIVITVDVPIMGRRYKDMRAGFKLPINCVAANLPRLLSEKICSIRNNNAVSTIKEFTDLYFENSLTWEDIVWIKSVTKLPVIIKGIMHPADAKIAVSHDIEALIVSNHGGRQLDTLPPTIEVLPFIAKATEKKIPILVDGGIRNGLDIFKALALGADCVCLGRPILWGLSVNGEQGVLAVLESYCQELEETMVLCGCTSISDIKEYGKQLLFSNSFKAFFTD